MISLYVHVALFRGFSPGTGSDNIVIGRCYAFNYYNYNYNFTTYCDIRQAPSSCVHQDDIALECIGEWSSHIAAVREMRMFN